MMILTVLMCLYMLIAFIRGNSEDDEENGESKTVIRRRVSKFFGLIPAIVAIIAFFLTEDMSLPMEMTDKWTLLMVIIAVVQVIVMIIAKNKKEEDDEDSEAAEA